MNIQNASVTVECEDEQDRALRLLHEGRSAFLTGPGGTGKSYVVRKFLEDCDAKRHPVVVAATTGVAAMLLPAGETFHRATGIPVVHDADTDADREAWRGCATAAEFLALNADETIDPPEDSPLLERFDNPRSPFMRNRLRHAKTLVLDEVSMADAHAIDAASWLVASIRGVDAPFGGMQVIFVGDLAQLPPVQEKRWGWAVDSMAWRGLDPLVISLDKIRRQSDPEFIGLLARLRMGRFAADDARALVARVGAFDPRSATRILSTNKECDSVNKRELAALDGELRVSTARDRARDGFEWMISQLDDCPSPKSLKVKIGARVLVTRNDPEQPARYANGSAGVLEEVGAPPFGIDAARMERDAEALKRFGNSRGESRLKRLGDLRDFVEDGTPRGVIVRLDSGERVWLELHSWKKEDRYGFLVERRQFPIRLGWAITAHRAQGSTLERASVNLSRCFAEGQAYVALSRVKSFEGLSLESSDIGVVAAHPRFLQFEHERLSKSNGSAA